MRTTRAFRLTALAIAGAVAIVVAHALDWWALEHLAMPRLQESDLGRMLRVLGFLPLWIVVAAAIALCEPAMLHGWKRVRRGGLLLASAAIGGIVAELLKILIRRRRPDASPDAYVFRPWDEETLYTGGLGMPSSHALVAFAAVAMLGYLFPRARPLWYALGAGCALARVATGAHFLSDVVVAAVAGFAVAELLGAGDGRDRAEAERKQPDS